jgi:prepilin-type N-terminal cleavage/methylation domain-containing protein
MNIIKTNRRTLQSGTTLIELSVVIAVILVLATVLFIGVKAWRDSANRAACIVNLASMQKAVRGWSNAHADDSPIPTSVAANALITEGYFGAQPVCPAGGTYSPALAAAITIPTQGTAAVACSKAGSDNHQPSAGSLPNW